MTRTAISYSPVPSALSTSANMPSTSAKQQRLLVESLYSSWAGPGEGRSFLVEANLGVFYSVHRPPMVPSVVLSVDTRPPEDLWARAKHAYFMWEYGRPPQLVIEIVSR